MRSCCGVGAMLDNLHRQSHVIFTTPPLNGCYHAHFLSEKSEAESIRRLSPGQVLIQILVCPLMVPEPGLLPSVVQCLPDFNSRGIS